MGIFVPVDIFQPGAYVRTAYKPGHDELFEIMARDGDLVWLENCRTGADMPIPARELHTPEAWALVTPNKHEEPE